MPERLVIEVLESGLRVSGELDILTVPQLRDAVPVVRDPSQGLVLDFAGVTFLDSSGLGLLLATAKMSKEQGTTLVLQNPSATVSRLLGMAIPDGVPGLVMHPPGVSV